jgi:hypothetical protein
MSHHKLIVERENPRKPHFRGTPIAMIQSKNRKFDQAFVSYVEADANSADEESSSDDDSADSDFEADGPPDKKADLETSLQGQSIADVAHEHFANLEAHVGPAVPRSSVSDPSAPLKGKGLKGGKTGHLYSSPDKIHKHAQKEARKVAVRAAKANYARRQVARGMDPPEFVSSSESSDSDSESEEPVPASTAGQKRKRKGNASLPTSKRGSIKLVGCKLKPIPSMDPKWRHVKFYAGRGGSGKSKALAEWVKAWMVLYPDRKIYGVSKAKLHEDPAFKGIPIRQIDMDDILKHEHAKLEEWFPEDCLVIMDDFDTYKGKELAACLKMQNDIMDLGRKRNVQLIITSHLLNNYNQTRNVIQSAEDLTFFPQTTLYNAFEYMLKKVGLSKDHILHAHKHMGDMVTVHTQAPCYMMGDDEVVLL